MSTHNIRFLWRNKQNIYHDFSLLAHLYESKGRAVAVITVLALA